MVFFGHWGITVGVVHAFNKKFKADVDLRKAAFFAELPDILDKPLGVAFPDFFGNRTRLIGHTVIFAILLAVLLKIKKLRHIKILYAAFIGHLILDRVWQKDLDLLFFPFLGIPEPLDINIFVRWGEAIFWPYSMGGEALGISAIGYLILKYRLYRPDRFMNFWNSGGVL